MREFITMTGKFLLCDTGHGGWEKMQPASNSLIAGGGSPGFRAKNAADRGFRPRL
jgi:hypothetical protein